MSRARAGHDSNIPCRRHKTSVIKTCMISIYYRNSETLAVGEIIAVKIVIPAKAGIWKFQQRVGWMPTCAGMTKKNTPPPINYL